MVPQEAAAVVDVVARTVLVDTQTGVELAGTSDEGIRELYAALRARHSLKMLDDAALESLLVSVQKNDQKSYRAALRSALGGEPEPTLYHALWLDLVGLMVGSQFSSSRFELPGQGQWLMPVEFLDQTALLVDDGAQRGTLVLHGTTFPENVTLSAMLRLEMGGRDVALPAEAIERGESMLSLHFPSLQALCLSLAPDAGLRLTLRVNGEDYPFDVLYLPKPAALVAPSSSSPSTAVPNSNPAVPPR
jgi:hypothetical protein